MPTLPYKSSYWCKISDVGTIPKFSLSTQTELITQIVFLFPIPYSLFPVSTDEFNFDQLLTE
jgi:hypothetical protein